jgi:hypothetical protein
MLGGAAAATIHDHVSALRDSSLPLARLIATRDSNPTRRLYVLGLQSSGCPLRSFERNKARTFPLAFAKLSQALPDFNRLCAVLHLRDSPRGGNIAARATV